MSFVNFTNLSTRRVTSKEIPEGTIFTGRIGDNSDTLFLKRKKQIWSLDRDARCTDNELTGCWASADCPVDDYRVVRSISVTVE